MHAGIPTVILDLEISLTLCHDRDRQTQAPVQGTWTATLMLESGRGSHVQTLIGLASVSPRAQGKRAEVLLFENPPNATQFFSPMSETQLRSLFAIAPLTTNRQMQQHTACTCQTAELRTRSASMECATITLTLHDAVAPFNHMAYGPWLRDHVARVCDDLNSRYRSATAAPVLPPSSLLQAPKGLKPKVALALSPNAKDAAIVVRDSEHEPDWPVLADEATDNPTAGVRRCVTAGRLGDDQAAYARHHGGGSGSGPAAARMQARL